MNAPRTFVLRSSAIRDAAMACVGELPLSDPPLQVVISEHRSKRSLEQNAAMWSALTAISEQVVWYGRRLSPENWKDIMTAALKKQDVVPNISGDGFVILGTSTSQMRVGEMSDLLDLINAFAAERGVKLPVAA